jgi:hypothetical protein
MPTDDVLSIPRVMASMPAPLPSRRREPQVEPDRLADCVRRLDPGTRALLDLSVRRRLRDDAMAPLLHTDAFHLAWRRARALERVASEVGEEEPLPLAMVRAALEVLPAEAWDPFATPLALPAPVEDADADAEEPVASKELVPATGTAVDMPQPVGVIGRLDSFATSAPTLRSAFRDVGRAFGRKAVRMVVWRRPRST